MNYKIKLQELRKENKKSQEEIANLLQIARITYSHFETQYNIIPLKHLNTICNYFNVSLDYVLGFNKTKNYNNIIRNELNINISSERLKEFRKEKKLTQEKLALFLNTTHSVISGIENRRNIISTSFLYAICHKYKISADYLLGKTNNPKYLN